MSALTGGKIASTLSGGGGAEVVSNTTAKTMRVIGFLVLTDTIFASVTADGNYKATGLTGVTFPAGMQLPFRLKAFQLTSGSVCAILAS
mgnify:CR=1 FL=1